MNQLEQARAQIDTVDRQMAALFEQRMAAVRQVIEYKQATGMPILDSGREAQVIEKNTAYIAEEVLRPYYADLLRAQMALSRQYQAYVLGRDVVAHQGAEGAYSHIALTRLFPRAKALSLATFDEVFDAVQDGRAAYGVIPFENSTAGDVSDVLDLLYNHSLYIVQMYDLPIRHNLLGVPGAHLRDVTDVYGHPQALRQSEAFLTKTGLATHSWPPQAPNNALAAQYGMKPVLSVKEKTDIINDCFRELAGLDKKYSYTERTIRNWDAGGCPFNGYSTLYNAVELKAWCFKIVRELRMKESIVKPIYGMTEEEMSRKARRH